VQKEEDHRAMHRGKVNHAMLLHIWIIKQSVQIKQMRLEMHAALAPVREDEINRN
jgi:hypothetical protein